MEVLAWEPAPENRGKSAFGLRGHLHLLWAQEPVAYFVSSLKLLDNRVLLVLIGRFDRHRLVNVRIECASERLERTQSEFRQRILDLLVNQFNAVSRRLRVRVALFKTLKRTLKVI